MRVQIWLGTLLAAAGLSALAFQPYEPETFDHYEAEKLGHISTRPMEIVQPAWSNWSASWGPGQSVAADPGERRADFQVYRSQAPRAVAWYLDQLFALTDAAAVEWRAAALALTEGRQPYLMEENHQAILDRLKRLKTPPDLLPFEAMVVEAIDAQRLYLLEWQEAEDPAFHEWDHELLEKAQARLAAAYAFLMDRYPNEDRDNQKAIRDHLNGPDFFS